MKSERRIRIKVKTIDQRIRELGVSAAMSITALKHLISYELNTSPDLFTLMHNRQILKLYRELSDYLDPGIEEVTLHLVRRLGHRKITPKAGLDAAAIDNYMQTLQGTAWCCWIDSRDLVVVTVIKDGILNHRYNSNLDDMPLNVDYSVDNEVDGNEIIAARHRPPVQIENDALREEVRNYARELAKSPKNTDILASLNLSDAESERLENMMRDKIDCVTYEIINVPVKFVAERQNHFIYELSILLGLPVHADGSRTIPNTTLPFHLRDIIPAPEAYEHIQNKLRQLKAWRRPEAPANQAPAAVVFRPLQTSPSLKDVRTYKPN